MSDGLTLVRRLAEEWSLAVSDAAAFLLSDSRWHQVLRGAAIASPLLLTSTTQSLRSATLLPKTFRMSACPLLSTRIAESQAVHGVEPASGRVAAVEPR